MIGFKDNIAYLHKVAVVYLPPDFSFRKVTNIRLQHYANKHYIIFLQLKVPGVYQNLWPEVLAVYFGIQPELSEHCKIVLKRPLSIKHLLLKDNIVYCS